MPACYISKKLLRQNTDAKDRILSSLAALQGGDSKRGKLHPLQGYDNLFSIRLKGAGGRKERLILKKLPNGNFVAVWIDYEHAYNRKKLEQLDSDEIIINESEEEPVFFQAEISEEAEINFAGKFNNFTEMVKDQIEITKNWLKDEKAPFISFNEATPGSGKTSSSLYIFANKVIETENNPDIRYLYLAPTYGLCMRSKAILVAELGEEIVNQKIDFKTYEDYFNYQETEKPQKRLDDFQKFLTKQKVNLGNSTEKLYHDCAMAISAGSLEEFKKLGDRCQKTEGLDKEVLYKLAKNYQKNTKDPNFTSESPKDNYSMVICDEAQALTAHAAKIIVFKGLDNLSDLQISDLCKKFSKKNKQDLMNDVSIFDLYKAFLEMDSYIPDRFVMFCGDSHQKISSEIFSLMDSCDKRSATKIYPNYRCSKAVNELCQIILDQKSTNLRSRKVTISGISEESSNGYVGILNELPTINTDINTAIIVMDPERKAHYLEGDNRSLWVFTPEEARGLEFQNVYIDVKSSKNPNNNIIDYNQLLVAVSRSKGSVFFIIGDSSEEDPLNKILEAYYNLHHDRDQNFQDSENNNPTDQDTDPDDVLSFLEDLIQKELLYQARMVYKKYAEKLHNAEYAERLKEILEKLNIQQNTTIKPKPTHNNPNKEFEDLLLKDPEKAIFKLLDDIKKYNSEAKDPSSQKDIDRKDQLKSRCNILFNGSDKNKNTILNDFYDELKLLTMFDIKCYNLLFFHAIKQKKYDFVINLIISILHLETAQQTAILKEVKNTCKDTIITNFINARIIILSKTPPQNRESDNSNIDIFYKPFENNNSSELLSMLGKIDSKNYDQQMRQLFLKALKEKNAEIILLLRIFGFSVNTKINQNNITALQYAADKGDFKCLNALLLDSQIEVNAKTNDGATALHLAASKGHTECLKLLLEKEEIDINALDNYKANALHLAAFGGHTECLKLLLEKKGIDINAKSDRGGYTALHFVASKGHTEHVKLLLEKEEIDINAIDEQNSTALHLAARGGHTECLKLLLEKKGIDINAKNMKNLTALDVALSLGHTGCIELLVELNPGAMAKRIAAERNEMALDKRGTSIFSSCLVA